MSLLARYETIVASGIIKRDPLQVQVLQKLEGLYAKLVAANEASGGSALRRAILRLLRTRDGGGLWVPNKQGIYLHGGVGSGKTMLMDLFHSFCPEPRKRRTHFNAFMLSVHAGRPVLCSCAPMVSLGAAHELG